MSLSHFPHKKTLTVETKKLNITYKCPKEYNVQVYSRVTSVLTVEEER